MDMDMEMDMDMDMDIDMDMVGVLTTEAGAPVVSQTCDGWSSTGS